MLRREVARASARLLNVCLLLYKRDKSIYLILVDRDRLLFIYCLLLN